MAVGKIKSHEKADHATVEQVVDLDHPHALDFLREDCLHVSDFFKKHGVGVMTIRELFDFIVDSSVTDNSVDSYLEEIQQRISVRGNVLSPEDEIADSVFIQSYIPKTLDSVKNVEEDVIQITSGKDTGDMYYKTITGLHKTLTKDDAKAKEKPSDPGDDTKACGGKSESDIDVDEDSEGSASASETEVQAPVDKKAARKENKKKVKEEKREAKKNKVPEAVKKRREKLAKAQKTR